MSGFGALATPVARAGVESDVISTQALPGGAGDGLHRRIRNTSSREAVWSSKTSGRQVHVDTGQVLWHPARVLTELRDGEDSRDSANFKPSDARDTYNILRHNCIYVTNYICSSPNSSHWPKG